MSLKYKKNKQYKCPECKTKYTSEQFLINHVSKEHKDLIPENNTVRQYLFNIRNKKTKSYCVICRTKETKWNEQTGKYERFCSPKCRKKAGEIADKNLERTTGKNRKERLNDPEIQRLMGNNRSISGTYTFKESGITIPYMGSYEKDFLRFYEEDFQGSHLDIMQCPYVLTYLIQISSDPDEFEEKQFIPDYFIPSLNLIIEVKDGGDNPNKHQHMILDREKERLKDQAVIKNGSFNYCKIYNKDYTNFINVVNLIREQEASDGNKEQVIFI